MYSEIKFYDFWSGRTGFVKFHIFEVVKNQQKILICRLKFAVEIDTIKVVNLKV